MKDRTTRIAQGERVHCNGTTWVGVREDGLGSIHVPSRDACRSVRIDSKAPGPKAWNVPCVREHSS